ncbi:MAG: hypothetical protein HY245_02880 [Rhizobiales bacterium]|nr:hypothetical protein [Hyphomicrobiales bacterium]MBI3672372.1 hypothetical protein [Hyphomicrobiales bacterium]
MNKVSAIALFCEYIRVESAGTETLIGILPDNIQVDRFPGIFPSLHVYTRIHLDPGCDDLAIVVRLLSQRDITIIENEIPPDLLRRTLADARKSAAPIAGLISRLSAMPFPIEEEGRLRVVATIGKEELLCGAINIILAPRTEES